MRRSTCSGRTSAGPTTSHSSFRSEMGQALWLLLLKPWLSIAGHGEVAARAPAVLFAAAACALLVPVGRTLLGGRLAGVAAGLLMACSAFVVALGAASSYLHATLLASVAVTYVFLRALRSSGWRWWLLYALAEFRRLHALLRWAGARLARSCSVDVPAAAGSARALCRSHRRAAALPAAAFAITIRRPRLDSAADG